MKSKNQPSTNRTAQPRRKPRLWLRILVSVLVIVVLAMGSLVAVPIISPAAGAAMADWLRGIIGPEPVAQIESVAFQLQDVFNRTRYKISGGQAQLNWDDPATAVPQPGNKSTQVPTPQLIASEPSSPPPTPSDGTPEPIPTLEPASTPLTVVTAPAQVTDWQVFGITGSAGEPILARAVVNPDPIRPYAQAALVRIDLSKVRLHMVPGTIEPTAVKGTPAVARPGLIPAADQVNGLLLAAFNGGFKAVHGGYGMQLDTGVVLRPPMDGIATLGLYQDGTVRIGAWGRDIQSGSGLIAYRQNCPLLVDAGQINPHVNDENRKEWGYTVKNLDTTWRSGVGLSKDGRFLIYAVGNSLTVESLAQALQEAGAEYAMQLDINGFYTRFVTYMPAAGRNAGSALVANKLLKEMSGDPAQFLHPYDRDFFYVTLKPSL